MVNPPDDEMQHGLESGSWRTVIGDKLASILIQVKENKMNWPRTIACIEATMQAKGLDIHKGTNTSIQC